MPLFFATTIAGFEDQATTTFIPSAVLMETPEEARQFIIDNLQKSNPKLLILTINLVGMTPSSVAAAVVAHLASLPWEPPIGAMIDALRVMYELPPPAPSKKPKIIIPPGVGSPGNMN